MVLVMNLRGLLPEWDGRYLALLDDSLLRIYLNLFIISHMN